MRLLLAVDTFGPDLRAPVAAAAIARGVEAAGLEPPDVCPGSATIDVLLPALGGETVGRVALVDDGGTAIVEDPADLETARAAGAQVIVVPPGSGATGPGIVEANAAFLVDVLDLDARMRAAFALVVAEAVLDRGTLEGRVTGELAVRARQAGVPCHAIAGRDALDPFDGRILDLQHVLEAGDLAGLERAGRDLGALLLAEVRPG